jgi:hypothetical protein
MPQEITYQMIRQPNPYCPVAHVFAGGREIASIFPLEIGSEVTVVLTTVEPDFSDMGNIVPPESALVRIPRSRLNQTLRNLASLYPPF